MKLNDHAAQIALHNGGFLLAGDYTGTIADGDIISVTERSGLIVRGAECVKLINAPVNLIMAACRDSAGAYQPFYSDMTFETPHQAAIAQLLNDAGEGFDIDDLLDFNALDSEVTIVSVEKRVHTL